MRLVYINVLPTIMPRRAISQGMRPPILASQPLFLSVLLKVHASLVILLFLHHLRRRPAGPHRNQLRKLVAAQSVWSATSMRFLE